MWAAGAPAPPRSAVLAEGEGGGVGATALVLSHRLNNAQRKLISERDSPLPPKQIPPILLRFHSGTISVKTARKVRFICSFSSKSAASKHILWKVWFVKGRNLLLSDGTHKPLNICFFVSPSGPSPPHAGSPNFYPQMREVTYLNMIRQRGIIIRTD